MNFSGTQLVHAIYFLFQRCPFEGLLLETSEKFIILTTDSR